MLSSSVVCEKVRGLLELVSGIAPATSTRPKTTKDGKGRIKNAPSIGGKEEVKLVYKMIYRTLLL
jgi:hypothetical protein